jgi:hypothetical protein
MWLIAAKYPARRWQFKENYYQKKIMKKTVEKIFKKVQIITVK